MTIFDLQDAMAAEIERITADMRFLSPKGEMTAMRAYKQALPTRAVGEIGGDEDDEDPYPYCIVRADSGEAQGALGNQKILMILIFGIYDPTSERQGMQAAINIAQRIVERFTTDPLLDNRFRLSSEEKLRWETAADEDYPYYFAAVSMTWEIPSYRRERDRYA
ncbi:MAG: hypothetical protein Q4C60_07540 [Eubacteriales bacterium]|nr:hypothetical protein [Eubacteriales bacterium]